MVRNVPALAGASRLAARILHPGVGTPIVIFPKPEHDGRLVLEVPVHRGCAMVVLVAEP